MEKSLRAFAATRKGKPIKPIQYCSIENCGRRQEARGWCHKHYTHWKMYGTPFTTERPTPEQRFWANVHKTDGCWLWMGNVNEHGYGLLTINGKPVRAHRFSYFLANGAYPMPMGRHTCDNPPCVNPAHIVPGTQYQNVQDRMERNRQPRGSKVGGSKLKEEQVVEIKRMLRNKIFQRIIAERFGVTATTIHDIYVGKSWRHIQLPDEL